tara:strand:+ start:307 stop:2250 length:1944 start_codon:yes stop_codon:yes gene_type:complete
MVSENQTIITNRQSLFFHIVFIFTAISLIFIRTLPLLLDPNLDYGGDEVFHAREIWEFLHGRDLFFYYENVNYHGTFEGFAAIPFVSLFGFYPLPYKLPVIIFYGFFIWSTFLILQTFNPKAGWIACFFLIFPPNWIFPWALLNNYVFSPTLFLGNLTLYYLIKIKTTPSLDKKMVFLLCFFSGLAIYIWTYSIIYIFTVVLLLALTHPNWDNLKNQISIKKFYKSFSLLKTKKEKIAKIYDLFLYVFIFAIAYSYVFGGFGLDIGGITIFQINNLHKPVIQVVPLIILRLLLAKFNLLPSMVKPMKLHFWFDHHYKKLVLAGVTGLTLGLLPRIISILNGSVSRGGQGFDMDFSPIKILIHTWELVKIIPLIMEIDFGVDDLQLQNNGEVFTLVHNILVFPLAALAAYSFYFFIRNNWMSIKDLIRLKGLQFSPSLILFLLPATLCLSVIVTMNGPAEHYLIPIYWVITIYVALFIVELLSRSKILGISFLLVWVVFYLIRFEYTIHEYFKYKGAILSNNQISLEPLLARSQKKYLSLIKFLNSNDINAVYAGYALSSNLIINSGGEIAAAEYSVSGRSKRLRKNLEKYPNFALIFHEKGNEIADLLKFLSENKISFEKQKLGSLVVFWGFSGPPKLKNKLRYLVG